MKKITVIADTDEAHKIAEALKDLIYYQHPVSKGTVKYEIFVPTEKLDEVLKNIQASIDLRKKENLIAVSSPDFVISSSLQRAEKRAKTAEKSPVEKLISSTLKYTKLDPLYLLLTSIAGVIALVGLFLNNIAVIIGAMLLSPLLGPIYAFAINIAVGRPRDGLKSIGNLALYLSVVIILSYILTLTLSKFLPLSLTPEILLRLTNSPVYLLIAILLGFAAVLALSKGVPESIGGIAIAAALLPPAVVAGIMLNLNPSNFFAPFLLTIENVLGLMTGALMAFPLLKIGPRRYYEKEMARKFMLRVALVLATLLLVTVLLGFL